MAKDKTKKIKKRITKLDSKGLREVQHFLNKIYVKDIQNRLKELNKKGSEFKK